MKLSINHIHSTGESIKFFVHFALLHAEGVFDARVHRDMSVPSKLKWITGMQNKCLYESKEQKQRAHVLKAFK